MKLPHGKLLRVLLSALCLTFAIVRLAAMGDAPDPAARLQQLRAEIAHHDELYFKKSAPEITDAAYDALKRELRALEQQYPELAARDPSNGDDRTGDFTSVKHRVRMQGLGKTYTEAELRAFLGKARRESGRTETVWVVEPKYDGLAISVTYDHGRLIRAVTRGNGVEGDDVTANLLALCDVPRQLGSGAPIPDLIELRGEVYMTYAEFKRINAEVEAAGGEAFAHPRNLATGTLKQAGALDVKRRLTIVFYGWGAVEPLTQVPQSQQDLHRLVRLWGLPGVEEVRTGTSDADLWQIVQEFGAKRVHWPFPTDGVVLKIDDTAMRARLGENEDTPRWAIAYKFAPAQAATKLRAITLQVGRTGVITPVAEIEPVKLGGATIRRVSLHNREDIARRDLRIGDTVFVERAGEIIPVVAGVDRGRRPSDAVVYQFPSICPSCASALVTASEQAAVRCENRECPAQVRRRLEYFASDDCADLGGFGPGVIDKLVTQGLLKEPADFFRLDAARLRVVVGEKTATKLLAAVARGRGRETWRLIQGFGVTGVGPAAAKALAKKFGDLERLAGASADSVARDGRSQMVGLSDAAASAWVVFLEREGGREALRRLQSGLTPAG